VDWPCPAEVDADTWAVWLDIRRRKRAPMTENALKLAMRVLDRANGRAQEVVAASAVSGWTGLFLPKNQAAVEEDDDPTDAYMRRRLAEFKADGKF
jgi:hypothetical protein